jgi:hypothetical protein
MTQLFLTGLVVALLAGAPNAAFAAQPAPPPVPAERTASSGQARTVQDDAERYAEREAQSKDAADFEGGHRGGYIGLSTGAVVIIAVLVILLILL